MRKLVLMFLIIISMVLPGTAFAADTVSPTAPSGLALTVPATYNRVELTWKASTDDVGVTRYDVYRDSVLIGNSATNTYLDTAVSPLKTYQYYVVALDAAGNKSAASNTLSVATPIMSDITPPTAPSNLRVTAFTATSASLAWTGSTDNLGVSGYEVYRNGTKISSPRLTRLTDPALAPGTTYTYYVVAYDAAGNRSAHSNTITVTTTGTADTTPPSAPTGLYTTVDSTIQPPVIDLGWVASTDNIGVKGYKVYRSTDGGTTYATIATTTSTNYTDSDIQPGTSYTYFVAAYDAANNQSAASNYVTETIAADTEPPSVPTGLTAGSITAAQIQLTWNASIDNIGVSGYEVYRSEDGVQFTFIDTALETTYTDITVLESTTYYYYVTAADGQGNTSVQSNTLTVSTPSAADTEAPAAPTGLQATNVASNLVSLVWTGSLDNVGVTGYKIYRDGVLIDTTTATNYTDNGVTGTMTYSYAVSAVDAAGNESALSASINVNTPTPPDTTPPTAPANLTANAASATQINLSWTASTDNIGVNRYEIFRNGVKLADSTSLNYTDNEAIPLTTYTYYVQARDDAGNVSPSSNQVSVTTPADTTAPTAPGNLTASLIAPSGVQLAWSAATDNFGVTEYDVYRNNTKVGTVTVLNYTDSGLTSGLLYTYYVVARDAAGNQSQPSNNAAVNIADTEVPSIPGNVQATAVSGSQVDVSWTASTDNIGVANYNIYRNNIKVATVTGTNYSDLNLIPSTSYSYYVVANDAVGNQSAPSTTVTVSTLADSVPPSAPTGLLATVTSTQINLSWTASTDNVAVTGYEIYRDNNLIGTTTGTTYSDTSALSGTATYFVMAIDGAGNKSVASNTVNATLADTLAPTAPALTGTAVQSNQVELTWSGSTDNVGVAGYDVYRNFVKIATTTTPSYTDTDTVANENYRYYVIAFDAAGNKSASSNYLVIVPADTIPPTVPTGLQVTVVSSSQVNLTWAASTDNLGVAGYEVYRNNVKLVTTNTTSYTDTTTVPTTIYTYYVVARDTIGNISAPSIKVTVTTPIAKDTTAPSVPSDINITSVTASEINLTWTAATDNIGVAGYLLYRDNVQIADLKVNQYKDTSVNPGTLYLYYVKAYDAAGNISEPSYTQNVTTPDLDTTPPDAPTNLRTVAAYYNSVELIWTATQDDVGVTGYDIYRSGVKVGTTTNPNYKDITVSPATTYTYYVVARDLAGNVSLESNNITITTPAQTDTQAPTIPTNLSQTTVTPNSITFSWQSATDNVGVMGYEVVRSNVVDGERVLTTTQPSYTDNNVQPQTQYTYRVRAVDAAGNKSADSSPITITTPAIADTMAPQAPGQLVVKAVSSSEVNLSWTAAGDNVGVTGYEVYRDNVRIASVNQLKYSDTGLSVGIKYTYYVIAVDAAGNKSLPSSRANITLALDSVPPSAPTGLSVVRYTSTTVELVWTAAKDNIGVTGYKVYRNGAEIGVTSTTKYTDNTVLPGKTYSYYVEAFDAVGNQSKSSATFTVVTPQDSDIIPPSVPTNLRAPSIQYNRVDIFWNSSTDNIGVQGYMVYRNGVYIGTSGINKFSDKTVATKTTYTYYVVAFDAAGNQSPASTTLTVTTPVGGDTVPPTVPTNLSATATAYNQVELTWSPSTDNMGVAGYMIYRNNVFVANATGSSYVDTRAQASTTYSYYVVAFDLGKNMSAASSTVTVTTPAAGTV